MPTAWRIVTRQWATSAFDGEGARLYGGRWNSPGRAAVYLADTRALAALETLVHHPGIPELAYMRFAVRFTDAMVERITQAQVHDRLNSLVVAPETQKVGDDWLQRADKPLLEVPSAIIPEEKNYLLNPRHPKFEQIKIGSPEAFAFDPRLLEN
jgi:RES domain-containing protein